MGPSESLVPSPSPKEGLQKAGAGAGASVSCARQALGSLRSACGPLFTPVTRFKAQATQGESIVTNDTREDPIPKQSHV